MNTFFTYGEKIKEFIYEILMFMNNEKDKILSISHYLKIDSIYLYLDEHLSHT